MASMRVRRFSLYEPAEFIKLFLVDKLDFKKVRDCVAVHVPCSSKKAGLSSTLEQLAGMCAKEVVPSGVPCCGMAGDRGMRYPDLTANALQHLDLPSNCTVRSPPPLPLPSTPVRPARSPSQDSQSPAKLRNDIIVHLHPHERSTVTYTTYMLPVSQRQGICLPVNLLEM